jgi:uncharacterized protein (DUF1697 family)
VAAILLACPRRYASMNSVPDRLIALLRGINVGGNKPIDMGRLRQTLANLGYSDVRTYLQSGNAIFTSKAGPAEAATTLEDAIAGEFGIDCRVIVRTAAEVRAIMAADPLLHLLGNPSRHFVAFPDGPPRPEGVTSLTSEDYGIDQLRVVDSHVYLWCPDGISKSPFARANFDRILGVPVTMRNWNTVTRLAELAGL